MTSAGRARRPRSGSRARPARRATTSRAARRRPARRSRPRSSRLESPTGGREPGRERGDVGVRPRRASAAIVEAGRDRADGGGDGGPVRRDDPCTHRRRRRGRAGSCSPSRRRPATAAARPVRADRPSPRRAPPTRMSGRWLIAATAGSWAAGVHRIGRAPQAARASASTRVRRRIGADRRRDDHPGPVREQVGRRPRRSRSPRGRPSDGRRRTAGRASARATIDAFVLATSVIDRVRREGVGERPGELVEQVEARQRRRREDDQVGARRSRRAGAPAARR